MAEPTDAAKRVEEVWRTYLNTGYPPDYLTVPWYMSPGLRPFLRRLPSNPRCRLCHAPFAGMGGAFVRAALHLGPSRLNPQICDMCERFVQEFQGGAEVEVSILFADVRGSTALAEQMAPAAFSQLISRFFQAVTGVIHRHNGLVEKLIGDEVTAFFVTGISGPDHARAALLAAKEVLEVTGHGGPAEPWVPVGVGVHSGTAFVGSVGAPGGSGADIVVLGDVPNTGARLASLARAGEILASETIVALAACDTAALEPRQLQLKGRSAPLPAWAVRPEGLQLR
jgi:adenylate cyclase